MEFLRLVCSSYAIKEIPRSLFRLSSTRDSASSLKNGKTSARIS